MARVMIVSIGKGDAYRPENDQIVGLVGEMEKRSDTKVFIPDEPVEITFPGGPEMVDRFHFYSVETAEVED